MVKYGTFVRGVFRKTRENPDIMTLCPDCEDRNDIIPIGHIKRIYEPGAVCDICNKKL